MTIDQIKELAGHRDVSPWVIKLVQDAVEIEREACAKACDDMARAYWMSDAEEPMEFPDAVDCAAAIRARGGK